MLLLYKITATNTTNLVSFNKLKFRNYGIYGNTMLRFKILVVTTDTRVIRAYILPTLFVFRMVRSFLLYFRFLTFRSTGLVTHELRRVIKLENLILVLAPSRVPKTIFATLFRLRIPFLFSPYQSNANWAINNYRFMTAAYGFAKLQHSYTIYTHFID